MSEYRVIMTVYTPDDVTASDVAGTIDDMLGDWSNEIRQDEEIFEKYEGWDFRYVTVQE